MGYMGISITAILILSISYQLYKFTLPPKLPHVELIYRRGQIKEKPNDIHPFKINISNQVIDDLNARLDRTRELSPPLQDAAFHYGFNTDHLKNVLSFWRNKYNWRERERFLNSLPQFKTYIGNIEIHFIHAKPAQTKLKVLPLLLLHGWPGSVREFYELIPILTTPQNGQDFVFEVVAPSLPGYGFSEKPKEKGYNTAIMASIMNDLMVKLGHKKYYVQGGDWGSMIGSNLAVLHPNRVLGFHSNMCFVNTPLQFLKTMLGSFWPTLIVEEKFVNKIYPYKQTFTKLLMESGYLHIQATKPDTVGVGLTDSPAGLASYILEKFSSWTNMKNKDFPDGNLEKKFTLTAMLDNIMIYWVTGTITSSMRLYAEYWAANSPTHDLEKIPVTVPTICARFPEELAFQPEIILRERYANITRVTDPLRGGHFAAFEEPKLLAADVFEGIGEIHMKYYSNSK